MGAIDIIERSVDTTVIDGLLRITTRQVTDGRGTVREFSRTSTARADYPAVRDWRQINVAETAHGAVRGLHGEIMNKLVGVIHGGAFGAYVDARTNSPSRGKIVTVPLVVGVQVLVPAGVCNGCQCVSEGGCQYLYCFDAEWSPGMAGVAVNPLDADLAIQWPVPVDPNDRSQVSAKDVGLPSLRHSLASADR